ncbi:hypothetical protein [Cellulomonas sp. URHE0023]|uniref:hypothetical protein n=1 Tax=Cellulomonas sp. URHE0023 TaxID=1380354 RepID=UPI000489AA0E|nr:hypothetical protein [Cellulomonas sp. URHE0023]
MKSALIIATTHRILPGAGDTLKAATERYTEHVRANEPGLMAHYSYVDEDNLELTLVQLHRDAASADEHVRVAGELIGAGTALAPTVRIQVYGEPGPMVLAAVERNSGEGVTVVMAPHAGPGFRR